ncbi:MAG: hypothetical protein K0S65_6448, partial [Labilithrix sp.]|nr:hypothetical protein [Labilithrix sp.]
DTKDGGKRGEEVVEPTCYKDDPIDVRTVAYKPARIQTGSCTDKVFPVLKGVFAASNGNIGVADIKNALTTQESAACAACVVGEDGDTWAPLVVSKDGTVIPNYGGCFEVLSEKASCGKAMQQLMACLGTVCAACTDVDDGQACVDGAVDSACEASTQDVRSTCGAGVNTYLDMCLVGGLPNTYGRSIGGSVQYLCVAPPK